jgi:hypothetical protein
MLTEIAKCSTTQDLRSLTQVSKCFADIACPVLNARHGIKVSEDNHLSVSVESFHALPIWRRSIGYKPLSLLSCRFSFTTSPEEQIRNLKALILFFSTQPVIESLSMSFWQLAATIPTNLLMSVFTNIRLTRCQRLSFHGSPSEFSNDTFDGAGIMPLPLHPELVGFNVDSSFLFTRFALPYTINAFNTSSVTTLSLTHTFLSCKERALIYSMIYIQTLETLSVDPEVPVATLHELLSRHPDLVNLCVLRGNDGKWSSFTPYRTIRLPKLMRLTGPAGYLSALLKGLTLPSTLLELEIYSQKTSRKFISAAEKIFHDSAHCTDLHFLSIAIPGNRICPIPETLASQVQSLRVDFLSVMTANFAVSFHTLFAFAC